MQTDPLFGVHPNFLKKSVFKGSLILQKKYNAAKPLICDK